MSKTQRTTILILCFPVLSRPLSADTHMGGQMVFLYPEHLLKNIGSRDHQYSLRDHQYRLRDHQCGCRGGNRFEKGRFSNLTKKWYGNEIK